VIIAESRPTVLELPSGLPAAVATQLWTPDWWDGEPDPPGLPVIWSRKPMVAVGGRPVPAELAVISELALTGWQGVWVSAFGNWLRREWFPAPAFRTIAASGAAQWAAEIFAALKEANGGRLAGFFDVFAWREPSEVLLCEVKVGRDRIHPNQRRFLGNALRLRPLSEFMIIEMPQPAGRVPALRLSTRPTALTIGTTNGPAAGVGGELLISPNGVAHFAGCLHKGGDPDYSSWASLSLPRAWERLGNGEMLPATGGQRSDLVAKSRCKDCVSHGPW